MTAIVQWYKVSVLWDEKDLEICCTTRSVQISHSVVSHSLQLRTAACQVSLSVANSWGLLKLMSIESVMPSNQLILCCPVLLLPSNFPSIRVFSNEPVLRIRWPKYWSFSFSAYIVPMVKDTAPCTESQAGIKQDSWEKYQQPQICRWYYSKGRK